MEASTTMPALPGKSFAGVWMTTLGHDATRKKMGGTSIGILFGMQAVGSSIGPVSNASAAPSGARPS